MLTRRINSLPPATYQTRAGPRFLPPAQRAKCLNPRFFATFD
ncbi:hypothetical protein [Hymenobacter sp. UV11]|nr:hypothetical protein [Hymenobacter sp. UV11]